MPDNPLEWKEVKERAEAIRDRLIGPSQVDDLTPPEALISGIVSEGVLTVLLGKWGSGKSFLALDWACCVASGKWWNRRRVVRGPVIYVYAEGVAGLKARKQAWEKANNVILDSFELTWYPAGLQLLDEVERLAFAAVAQGEGCALVILDTLNRNIPGGDENTSRDMGALIHAADLIRSAVPKCTVLVLHHPGREGDHGRGHSSLDGAADTLLMVKKDGDVVTLYCDKQKDGAEFEPIRLHLTEVGDSCVLLPKGDGSNEAETRTEEKLLSVLWQHFDSIDATATELLRVSEIPESSFYRALSSLVRKGLVLKVGTEHRPKYRPNPDPQEWITPTLPNDSQPPNGS